MRAEGFNCSVGASGLYVWLNPTPASTVDIANVIRTAPFKTRDGTELHLTVLHCSGVVPNRRIFSPANRIYRAKVLGFETWQDHKDRTIVVLKTHSKGLHQLHNIFVDQGADSSHPEFIPHVTIGKGIELNSETRLWLSEQNQLLAERELMLEFGPELRCSPIM